MGVASRGTNLPTAAAKVELDRANLGPACLSRVERALRRDLYFGGL